MLRKANIALIFLSLALFILGAPVVVKAQEAEVEIDMTVLGDISPAAGTETAEGLPITRPIERPARPTLTQPTITSPTVQRPAISSPVIETPTMKPTVFQPTEIKPTEVKASEVPPVQVKHGTLSTKELVDYPYDPDAKIRPPSMKKREKPKVISFPIEVRERTDSTNPALSSEELNDVAPHSGGNSVLSGAEVPMPALKPVAIPAKENLPKGADNRIDVAKAAKAKDAPKREVTKVYANTSGIPIPGRRPARQMASKSFVNTARIHAVKDISKSGMDMPALPAKRVFAEPLSAPPDIGLNLNAGKGSNLRGVQNDDLARKLKTPNKDEMLASIERVAEMIDAIHGKPQGVKAKYNTDNLNVPKLAKPDLALDGESKHPVFAVPIEVPKPARKPVSNSDTVILDDITAVEPSAGGENVAAMDITEQVAPQIDNAMKSAETEPVQQAALPAGDTISIKFNSGQTDADKAMLDQLAVGVLQRLRNDHGLRLQMQAYAMADGQAIKNARRGSLSRALSLRNYLIEQGIESSRIDVRALGSTIEADRVDLVLIDPRG